ncbi:asparaginase [Methylocapsa acidiphila]|uniref:asparaginase n=1 Tax=Methylocapsa acidiphila TaxID=133552 RepID=UPI00041B71CC|nr:asparaginase [Methylocapsa acidiphila]
MFPLALEFEEFALPHAHAGALAKRARLIILSAGGTIAMAAEAVGEAAGLKLGAASLVAAVPQIADIAEIDARDLLAKPSASLLLADIAAIARAAMEAAATVDGVVITHGTDTLEETGFALSLLAQVETPIVLTAAMRRADQPGADGSANLLAACRVAVSPESRGKGVLIVIDDEIHAAPLIRKAHSFRPHAFSSLPFGPLGYVAEDRVRFALAPARRPPPLAYGEGAPVVPILEAGPGLEPQTIEMLAPGAIDGLVLSLPGAGHVAAEAAPALEKLSARMPVVFASRTGAGETLRASYAYPGGEIDLIRRGLIPANGLDARKARIALQLALSNRAGRDEISALFTRF